jgi:hypothetical protein
VDPVGTQSNTLFYFAILTLSQPPQPKEKEKESKRRVDRKDLGVPVGEVGDLESKLRQIKSFQWTNTRWDRLVHMIVTRHVNNRPPGSGHERVSEMEGSTEEQRQRWLTNRCDDLEADLQRAKAELISYRSQHFVPRRDYDAACQQRDQYARAMDGLARQVADMGDRRTQTTADRALSALQRVLDLMGRTAWGDAERRVLRDAKAVLVEAGRNPYLPEEP